MKKIHSFIKTSALLLVCWMTIFPQSETPFSINEAPIPNNGQPVNDFANVIDDATEQQLNQKIKDFRARTTPPVALVVATVPTTNGRPMEEYALALYRGWKIGDAGQDNPGALLLIAVNDKKYRTEVGRDLEDELPDGLAAQLQRQYLVPELRQGNYSKGVNDTIDAYIRTIEQRTSGTVSENAPQNEQTPGRTTTRPTNATISTGACCVIILVILMIIIFSRGGSGRGGRGGGFGGGGGALPWIIGSIIANSAGSRGSSWDGGGFGGGGGGDFGGGGASGDW
jgi:uncharacterized protein